MPQNLATILASTHTASRALMRTTVSVRGSGDVVFLVFLPGSVESLHLALLPGFALQGREDLLLPLRCSPLALL